MKFKNGKQVARSMIETINVHGRAKVAEVLGVPNEDINIFFMGRNASGLDSKTYREKMARLETALLTKGVFVK